MRSLRTLASLFAALALAAASPGALAAPPKKKPAVTAAARPKAEPREGKSKSKSKSKSKGSNKTQSIGAPNAGHLTGAARLKGTKVMKQREGAHSWGLPQLVHLLERASATVAKKHKGAQMLVGDLSGRTGGLLEGHGSHQTGRDADIAFYVVNEKGKPAAIKHFVPFDGSGRGRLLTWAVFDEARNWALVEAFLKDDKASVRYLFIANTLKGRLLAYAMRKGVDKDFIVRASTVMMSPPDADLHDDHFHVRIACPESMRDVCIEEAMVRGGGGGVHVDALDDKPNLNAAPGGDAPAVEPKAAAAPPPVIAPPAAPPAAPP